jgi:hypothetical protein
MTTFAFVQAMIDSRVSQPFKRHVGSSFVLPIFCANHENRNHVPEHIRYSPQQPIKPTPLSPYGPASRPSTLIPAPTPPSHAGFPAARAKPDKASPFLFRGNSAAPVLVPHHGHGTPPMPLGTGPAQQHSINAAEAALNRSATPPTPAPQSWESRVPARRVAARTAQAARACAAARAWWKCWRERGGLEDARRTPLPATRRLSWEKMLARKLARMLAATGWKRVVFTPAGDVHTCFDQ